MPAWLGLRADRCGRAAEGGFPPLCGAAAVGRHRLPLLWRGGARSSARLPACISSRTTSSARSTTVTIATTAPTRRGASASAASSRRSCRPPWWLSRPGARSGTAAAPASPTPASTRRTGAIIAIRPRSVSERACVRPPPRAAYLLLLLLSANKHAGFCTDTHVHLLNRRFLCLCLCVHARECCARLSFSRAALAPPPPRVPRGTCLAAAPALSADACINLLFCVLCSYYYY